jgi:hypothetical protein
MRPSQSQPHETTTPSTQTISVEPQPVEDLAKRARIIQQEKQRQEDEWGCMVMQSWIMKHIDHGHGLPASTVCYYEPGSVALFRTWAKKRNLRVRVCNIEYWCCILGYYNLPMLLVTERKQAF